MIVKPVDLILKDKSLINQKVWFVSGNETTLIEKIKKILINKFREGGDAVIEYIKNINDQSVSDGLFFKKKIFICENIKDVDLQILDELCSGSNIYIFVIDGVTKIKKIKQFLIKSKNIQLIECYELDRHSKERIINKFFKDSKIKLSEKTYWFLVDRLDNRYIFLEDQLKKIKLLGLENIDFKTIKKILIIDTDGKEKLFFELFKKNSSFVELYNNKIVNETEFNELFYYSKFFINLIINSKNENDFQMNIPRYLFREKELLLQIYKKYNLKKKVLLLNILYSTEKMLRKNYNFSKILGLRFLLKFKKITIS